MKYLIYAAVAAFISTPAQAIDWRLVDYNERTAVFLDYDSVSGPRHYPIVWDQMIFNQPDNGVFKYVVRKQYYCNEGYSVILGLVSYKPNGQVKDNFTFAQHERTAEYAVPGSLDHALFEAVCLDSANAIPVEDPEFAARYVFTDLQRSTY